MINYIFLFLENCCLEIESYYLNRLKELEKNGGFYYSITVIDAIIDPEQDDDWYTGSKEFIQYLKDRFNIRWLNKDTTKIKEIKKNSIIKIIDGTNELILTIIPETQEAVLSEGENVIFKFNIYKIEPSTYGIDEFRKSSIEEYLSSNSPAFDYHIDKHLIEFCIKILKYNLLPSYDKKDEYTKQQDLKLLSKDVHFLNLVNNVKNNFDKYYYEFIKIGNQ